MREEETCRPGPSGELEAARRQGIEHVAKKETVRLGLLETLWRLGNIVLTTLQNSVDLLMTRLPEGSRQLMSAPSVRAAFVMLASITLSRVVFGMGGIFCNEFAVTGLWAMGVLILIRTLMNHRQLPVRVKQWRSLASTLPELEKKT